VDLEDLGVGAAVESKSGDKAMIPRNEDFFNHDPIPPAFQRVLWLMIAVGAALVVAWMVLMATGSL